MEQNTNKKSAKSQFTGNQGPMRGENNMETNMNNVPQGFYTMYQMPMYYPQSGFPPNSIKY